MNVKELKEKLSKFDENLPVVLLNLDNDDEDVPCTEIISVEQNEAMTKYGDPESYIQAVTITFEIAV